MWRIICSLLRSLALILDTVGVLEALWQVNNMIRYDLGNPEVGEGEESLNIRASNL